ncbi:hypothetical protein C0Z18_02410 [Trinickia dabaoshanensis]|uniref:DUF1641 domain-containing protein n=1 Tax=Trinickia dabaoshanensis TaxID=564714 RepID=A0A2N7W114_9BURK|nr:hypothetical protein [Trinickia dabaoshanensis]PMS23090.1 hypothetical protein C0Z18_02410 [Trinickia dabaoshanensis]
MAERIDYEPDPPKIEPDAHEALERLVQSLHEHGLLRFANDLVRAKTPVAQVLVDGLAKPGTLNAIQNLSIVLMALSRIEPNQLYKTMFALTDALKCIGAWQPDADGEGHTAPGFTGAYKMLHDDALWQALTPLIEAMKAFSAGLERPVDKPISAFTGKPSSA